MTGHPQATALYGAPRLLWMTAKHPNDNARAECHEETRCGLYRRYRQGKAGNWCGVYLPDPTGREGIFIEHTLDKLMERIEADHQRRATLAVAA